MGFRGAFTSVGMKVFACVFLFIQRRITFYKPPPHYLLYHSLSAHSVSITTMDGCTLQGWRFPGNHKNCNRVGIYFGGNAQECASVSSLAAALNLSCVYTFNYRGYGLSQGEPSQKQLFSDATVIGQFVERCCPNAEIIVIGFSLGAAVAGFLASTTKLRGCILACPLSSVSDLVAMRSGLNFPDAIIRNNFNLCEYAGDILSPTLVFVAAKDTVIPPLLSQKVCKQLNCVKEILYLDDADHNDVLNHAQFVAVCNEFIASF